MLHAIALVVALAGTEGTADTLLRAVGHDKNLEARTPEGLRLGVVFDPTSELSRKDAEAFADEARSAPSMAPDWVELIPFTDGRNLYAFSRKHQVSILYIATGLSAKLPAIVRVAEAAGLLTLAGVAADVENGLALGLISLEGTRKLVVNFAAADRAGVHFDGAVRQVARRVGEAPSTRDRQGAEQALASYAAAIEEADLAALRLVWPALDGDEEKRVQASFKMTRSQQVHLALLEIESDADEWRARVRRTDKLVTKDGKTATAGTVVEVRFTVVRGAWKIISMSKAGAPPKAMD
jgi:hypothetical protein